LKVKKNRKFMGAQDDLALVAAGRALESAGLLGLPLGERAGLFLAVGYIPFEEEDIDSLLEVSADSERFCMERFSTEGYDAVNPLLTFKCLSNMPAFHISANFDIQGSYFVTYPGTGQFYLALEEACFALKMDLIDVALVCGAAHQRNFLVNHHFNRISIPVPSERLMDGAGCLVIETKDHGAERNAAIRGRLLNCEVSYSPFHPFEDRLHYTERFEGLNGEDGELGPASLPVALSLGSHGTIRHEVATRDGIAASSEWELL
jgi:3-oxoacyl-(acyl-carrier-protein) synthase